MTRFTSEYRAKLAAYAAKLRQRDVVVIEIAQRLGVSGAMARRLVVDGGYVAPAERCPAVWPRVVTRINADGTAVVVRT